MSTKSELDEYKKFVKQKLDEIASCLAHISVGDFTRRFDIYNLPNDEFAELFCGLDLMMDDLMEARRELENTNRNLEKLVALRTAELNTEKDRLAITLRSIAEGVITTDTNGMVTMMNKTAEEITGKRFEESKGRPFHDVFTAAGDRKQSPCPHTEENRNILERDIRINEGEILLACREGKSKTIAYSMSPIIEHTSNTMIGNIVVFRDIDEKRKTENELFRMKKLESVGLLAGGIAHDFNNILTGIISNIQITLCGSPTEKERNELLKDAESAALRAVNLARQLLTFSKGGAPVRENASLFELIDESVKFCLSGTNVNANVTVQPDLWLAKVDKGQMNQVLNNIIINAVHAMPDGGSITVSGRNIELAPEKHTAILLNKLKPGKYIEITITDQGAGIAPEYIDKVFDPYFTTKATGCGLGLTIAYSIMKNHNGHITVTSNGEGSSFSLYLPANPSAKQPHTVPAQRIKTGDGSVLVMDDDAVVLKALEKLLELLGYTVVCTCNGEEALARYRERYNSDSPFSLIIMDLTVKGGMGGKETIKEIRKGDDNTKVIVSSGYSNDPIIADYRSYGFDGVIPKPFTISELSAVISEVFTS